MKLTVLSLILFFFIFGEGQTYFYRRVPPGTVTVAQVVGAQVTEKYKGLLGATSNNLKEGWEYYRTFTVTAIGTIAAGHSILVIATGTVAQEIFSKCNGDIELRIEDEFPAAETALSAAAEAPDTVISVNDTANFPDKGLLKIENEYIWYERKTTTAFEKLTRGIRSTPAAHPTGATVTYIKERDRVIKSFSKDEISFIFKFRKDLYPNESRTLKIWYCNHFLEKDSTVPNSTFLSLCNIPETEPDLIALWHFDEGGGTVADDSKGNRDGTLEASPKDPAWVKDLKIENQFALDFDEDDRVTLNRIDWTNESFSFRFDIKITSWNPDIWGCIYVAVAYNPEECWALGLWQRNTNDRADFPACSLFAARKYNDGWAAPAFQMSFNTSLALNKTYSITVQRSTDGYYSAYIASDEILESWDKTKGVEPNAAGFNIPVTRGTSYPGSNTLGNRIYQGVDYAGFIGILDEVAIFSQPLSLERIKAYNDRRIPNDRYKIAFGNENQF
jgi:hypothetical protein